MKQVLGLGVSGRAAARLALARGASVLAIDSNESLLPLEVWKHLFFHNTLEKSIHIQKEMTYNIINALVLFSSQINTCGELVI